MESGNSKNGSEDPTNVLRLSVNFLELCGNKPGLMTKVYRAAMNAVGAEAPTAANTNSSAAVPSPRNDPSKLTSEEVKKAKEDFRKSLGLSKLTPDQAKMAKAIARQKKERASSASKESNSNISSKKEVKSKEKSKEETKPKKSRKEKEENSTEPSSASSSDSEDTKTSVPKKNPTPSGERLQKDPSVQLGGGSRATWSVKLKAMRNRALERGIAASESQDPVDEADYYNAYLTLRETWERMQNTFDVSGKKDPLQDLSAPRSLEELRLAFKQNGIQLRTHQTGHIILQDETTGRSLRRKL